MGRARRRRYGDAASTVLASETAQGYPRKDRDMALDDAARERWAGGTAVITGAGSGIGRGMARAAASMGMAVVLADVDGKRIDAVAAELASAGGRTVSVATDVTDFASVE